MNIKSFKSNFIMLFILIFCTNVLGQFLLPQDPIGGVSLKINTVERFGNLISIQFNLKNQSKKSIKLFPPKLGLYFGNTEITFLYGYEVEFDHVDIQMKYQDRKFSPKMRAAIDYYPYPAIDLQSDSIESFTIVLRRGAGMYDYEVPNDKGPRYSIISQDKYFEIYDKMHKIILNYKTMFKEYSTYSIGDSTWVDHNDMYGKYTNIDVVDTFSIY